MRTRRQTRMCRAGWYYLLIVALVLSGALLREVNLLLLLAAMLIGPWLLSRSLAGMTLRGLNAQRKLPHGVCAGDLLVAKVFLTNSRRHLGSWAVVAEDSLTRTTAGEERRAGNHNGRRNHNGHTLESPQIFFPYLPSGGTCKGNYHGRLVSAALPRGAAAAGHQFPLRTVPAYRDAGHHRGPYRFAAAGPFDLAVECGHHEAFAGTDQRERRPGMEGDFYGVRPWRQGDSRRWIHWRTAARTGALAVRQFEQPRNRDVVLLLELGQAAATPAARERGVGRELCRHGDCRPLSPGKQRRVPGDQLRGHHGGRDGRPAGVPRRAGLGRPLAGHAGTPGHGRTAPRRLSAGPVGAPRGQRGPGHGNHFGEHAAGRFARRRAVRRLGRRRRRPGRAAASASSTPRRWNWFITFNAMRNWGLGLGSWVLGLADIRPS